MQISRFPLPLACVDDDVSKVGGARPSGEDERPMGLAAL
jgi:hypothetical protein